MSAYREPARITPDPAREAAELRRLEAELRRSQRRRERVVAVIKWTLAGLLTAAILAHKLRDPKFYTARTKRAVNSLTVERGPKGGAA